MDKACVGPNSRSSSCARLTAGQIEVMPLSYLKAGDRLS